MAKRQQDGCGALAAVAIAAFLLGRCSAGDSAPRASDAAPARFSSEAAADAPRDVVTPPAVETPFAPDAEPEPARETRPMRFVSPTPSRSSGTSFRNCSEARAAGAAPVLESDPGYAPRLDRDGDGVGCE
jgi:hypothetical protein